MAVVANDPRLLTPWPLSRLVAPLIQVEVDEEGSQPADQREHRDPLAMLLRAGPKPNRTVPTANVNTPEPVSCQLAGISGSSSRTSRDNTHLERALGSGVRLERLQRCSAGAELLCLAPRVLELRSCVGVDQLAGLDPLEPVPL
jgi:hypothetical protein